MKIDWCGSMTIPFVATSDSEVLNFSVRSNLKGFASFAALYYLIFKPNEWIVVDQDD